MPDGHDMPDYEIRIGAARIFVEIKELTLNKEEQLELRGIKEKVRNGTATTIGDRIRKEIERARRQLKRHAKEGHPSVLLVYDARPFPFRGISEYEIKVAMYGFEAIDIHIPANVGEPIRWGIHRFGKGKKMRPDSHTYISSIGVLRPTRMADEYCIDLYNNIHAQNPLPWIDLVHIKDMSSFTLAPGSGNEFRSWERMVTADQHREQSQN